VRVHGRLGGLAAVVAVLVAALLAGGLVGAEPRSAAADPSDRKRRLDRELAELRHDLEGTAADLVDAVLELKRSQADLAEARSAAVAARAALTQARRRDAELATRLAVAEAAVVKAARELRARGAQERATRARVGQLAREAYLTSGLTTLAVALDAESPDEFAGRLSALSAALRTQNGTIERLDVQQAETRARREKLTAARAEVARLKREAEAAVVARAAAERTAAAAEGRVVQVVTRRAAAVGVIQARKQAEQRRVAAMEREQARLAALLAARSRGRSGGSAPDGGSTLSYPVTAPVTSGYGRRYHPVLHYWRLHAGTDFGAPCGAPVRAAASGTVVRAGWAGGYGKQLVIDHGRMRGVSVATSSNHLSRFVVQSGFVRRGQTVAYSGTTGLSTGCHLHFEVWVNGRTVNPMSWL
jgi:murein DD-endopeptidase MepM/ murein hydrolase activator NlpD